MKFYKIKCNKNKIIVKIVIEIQSLEILMKVISIYKRNLKK